MMRVIGLKPVPVAIFLLASLVFTLVAVRSLLRSYAEIRVASHRQLSPALPGYVLPFMPVMTDYEKISLLRLLSVVASSADKIHATYMMSRGTLLGSYRHHDVIPWDDDIDVWMNIKDSEAILAELQSQDPTLYGVKPESSMLKFYYVKFNGGDPSTKYANDWPYVHVNFFRENDTHVWSSKVRRHPADRVLYPKSIIYPTHLRPFGMIALRAPRDAYAYLRLTYPGTIDCSTSLYSHKNGKYSNTTMSLPCERLRDWFPFVHRQLGLNGGVDEVLKKRDKFIHSSNVDEPEYAITNAFSLSLI